MRRLRALAVISVLWAVLFMPVVLIEVARYWLTRHDLLPLRFILQMIAWQAIYGAASGLVFGLVLMIAERHRTVEKLRLGRMLAWGTIGALIPVGIQTVGIYLRVPNLWSLDGTYWMFASIITYGIVEGLVAAGATFAIARRGPPSIAGTPRDEVAR